MPLCQHLLTLKLQKIGNYITRFPARCTGNKKHEDAPLDLCLSCGESRCEESGPTSSNCSLQHSYGTKHPLVYRLSDRSIYCFKCDASLTQAIAKIEPDWHKSNKMEKVIESHDRIVELAQGIETKDPVLPPDPKKKKKEEKKPEECEVKPQLRKTVDQFKQRKEQHVKEQSQGLAVFGLTNLGNTCFFNSTLQCLYATEACHRGYHSFDLGDISTKREVNLQFRKFLRNKQSQLVPKGLFGCVCKSKGMYRQMGQQDAQELMGVLLNALIDGEKTIMVENGELQKGQHRYNSLTEVTFGFHLASRLECLECEKVSWRSDFTLDIPVEMGKSSAKKAVLPQGKISPEEIGEEGYEYPELKLTDSFLDAFFAPQNFTKNNYFHCQNCDSAKAFRKFYIKRPPKVLVVSLKRFNSNGSKNNGMVRVPPYLDISGHSITPGQHEYEIYGMVVHGGTSRGGHYVAYTRRGQLWYYFSDSQVRETDWNKVKNAQPYIMFYKRVSQ